MAERRFRFASHFPCTARELYDWHSRPGALERLLPPWDKTRVISQTGLIEPGARVVLRLQAGPFACQWHARHVENVPGALFRDIQEKGPFATWSHTHRFTDTPQGALLEDEIEYALPGQALLPDGIDRLVKRSLERVFRYRHATLRGDILLHQRCGGQSMRLLITGASGLLGSALRPLLTTGGHEVWTLVRRAPVPGRNEIYWNPAEGQLNLAGLAPFDGVIHLAGDNIGEGSWTRAKKRRMIDSRVQGTTLIARTIAALPIKPTVLLSASAVGFYGNCGDCCMREEEPAGADFISDICTQWEQSARPAEEAGIRTVLMRIGVVLSPRGGALQRLLATSAIGFFRGFGEGKQYISWIGINDMVGAVVHALHCERLAGPVNIAAPGPVTNGGLMQTLARVVHRPLLPSIPVALLKLLYGQMASEVLLGGCRVFTDKLEQSGYVFRQPSLEPALRQLLGKA